MKLDWIETYILAEELDTMLPGSRLQGAWVLEDRTLMLRLYRPDAPVAAEKRRHLMIRLHAGGGILWMQPGKEEAPEKPPDFAMLLRKHIEDGELTHVQPHYGDRMITFGFQAHGETYEMHCMLEQASTNIILCDATAHPLGALENSSQLRSQAVFEFPGEERPCLLDATWEPSDARAALQNADHRFFYQRAKEFTPNFLKYLIAANPESLLDPHKVQEALDGVLRKPVPRALVHEGSRTGFSVWPPTETEERGHRRSRLIDVLGEVLPQRRGEDQIHEARKRALKIVEKEMQSRRRSLEKLEDKLLSCEEWEQYEETGNLLNTQRDHLRIQGRKCRFYNIFTDPPREVEIAWDPSKSVQANIKQCYTRARKLKKGIEHTRREIQRAEEMLTLYSRVQARIRHAVDLKTLDTIMEGLNFPDSKDASKRKSTPTTTKKKARFADLRRLMTSEGLLILAGRNDRENEYLLRHAARGEDRWFHVKDAPGAHVLLKQGHKAAEASLREAAQLAAYLSRFKSEIRAAVMVAEPKHVRLSSNGPSGMVKVDKHDTLTVNLDMGIMVKLEKNLLRQAGRGED